MEVSLGGGLGDLLVGWAYQFAHQSAAGEVALEEHDEVSFGQENSTAENHDSWLPSNRFIESVETGRGKDESSNIRQQRKHVNSQTDAGFLAKPREESLHRHEWVFVLIAVRAFGVVLLQCRVVHCSQLFGVLAGVFLVVGLVDPGKGVHEHVVKRGGDVAHQGHEEEGHLEDGVLDEVDAFDYVGVPGGL